MLAVTASRLQTPEARLQPVPAMGWEMWFSFQFTPHGQGLPRLRNRLGFDLVRITCIIVLGILVRVGGSQHLALSTQNCKQIRLILAWTRIPYLLAYIRVFLRRRVAIIIPC